MSQIIVSSDILYIKRHRCSYPGLSVECKYKYAERRQGESALSALAPEMIQKSPTPEGRGHCRGIRHGRIGGSENRAHCEAIVSGNVTFNLLL